MFKRVLIAAILMPAAATAGPLSKFDSRTPISDYVSPAKLEDIERCLLDMNGPGLPSVFRQPDRPDDVTLIWVPGMDAMSRRISLHRVSAGTHFTSWMPDKQAAACAPEK